MKLTEGKGDIDSRLHTFLLQYRAATVRGEKSPAEKAVKHTPRLPVVLAQPGSPIFYEVFRKNEPQTFQHGTIVSTSGSTCVNLNDLTGKGHIRHYEQVKSPPGMSPTSEETIGCNKSETRESTAAETSSDSHTDPTSSSELCNAQHSEINVTPEPGRQSEVVAEEPALRRSSRPRKLPEKFDDYVLEGRR